jgi:hypothetical protein
MDPFTFIVAGGMLALIVALLLLGKYYPGSGADVLDWKPTRSMETEVELELDDVEQMIEAQNERRRRTGRPLIEEDEFRRQVAADQAAVDEFRSEVQRERTGPAEPEPEA